MFRTLLVSSLVLVSCLNNPALADEISLEGMVQARSSGVCPRPPRKVALPDIRERCAYCGDDLGCTSRCQNKVIFEENPEIEKYNAFIDQCLSVGSSAPAASGVSVVPKTSKPISSNAVVAPSPSPPVKSGNDLSGGRVPTSTPPLSDTNNGNSQFTADRMEACLRGADIPSANSLLCGGMPDLHSKSYQFEYSSFCDFAKD